MAAIHGELLMLGFSVSQATVSRYMPARSKTAGAIVAHFSSQSSHAFGHCEYSEEWPSGNAGPQSQFYSAQLEHPGQRKLRRYGSGASAASGEHSLP